MIKKKLSNSINKCKLCEVPKRKTSKTSSEAHKVMLNLPSPLMTEANYKLVVLAAPSTQRKTLTHSFFIGLVDPVIREVTVQ